MAHLTSTKSAVKPNRALIQEKVDALAEINPMLGHRGCRIAISYPEIYEMQVRAIFEAAYRLQKEKIDVYPEIMVPIVMNFRELKQIVYGKKIEGHAYQGIVAIEESVRAGLGAKPLAYKIGTMIELPAAAISAGEIARYAQFFSFGTNDLTQTTLGLSRDDFNSFMPDYTMYDLIDGNPFAILDPRVRELIEMAVKRGTASRPDLKKGLCGEHGARPENIRFCMDAGLNYVSCSSYSVPIALLSIAQIELEKAEKEGRVLVQKVIKAPAEAKAAAPKAEKAAKGVKAAKKAAPAKSAKPAKDTKSAKAAAKPGKAVAKAAKAPVKAVKAPAKAEKVAKPATKVPAKSAAKTLPAKKPVAAVKKAAAKAAAPAKTKVSAVPAKSAPVKKPVKKGK
jgi:pyruvate,orthophosphate dikinase